MSEEQSRYRETKKKYIYTYMLIHFFLDMARIEGLVMWASLIDVRNRLTIMALVAPYQ